MSWNIWVMQRKFITTISCTLFLLIVTRAMLMAANVTETEPNDSPANANSLTNYNIMIGAIDPVSDLEWGVRAVQSVDALS